MFEQSMKGPTLFIRHGETEYNKILLNTPQKEAQLNEDYLDCQLSADGKLMAMELSEKIKNLKIKYVFCSPLRRCLETISIALQEHPSRQDITVIVHPLISEVINSCHDISIDIKKKKETYNEKSNVKFSWMLFDEMFPEKQDLYFLQYMDNLEISEDIEKLLNSETLAEGFYKSLLKNSIVNNKRPESLAHLNARSIQFLKYLKDFVDSEIEIDDSEKLLVMTHSAMIRMSSSEKAKTMDKFESYPEDCYKPGNCEVITINLPNMYLKS